MLILLPPSEGKSTPESGKKLQLDSLFGASYLSGIRKQVLDTNPDIDTVRCRPAHEIYSGVLYQALDWESLSSTAKKRGSDSILIISALMGALRIEDAIPTYKLKIATSLWKEQLSSLLDSLNSNLIVDCRSSTYAGVWTPPPQSTVAVRVFQIKGGKKSVITHMSKRYRGELTRLLLTKKAPRTAEELHAKAREKFTCDLIPATGKNPTYLDLLIEN
jgi:uncharacterized protein